MSNSMKIILLRLVANVCTSNLILRNKLIFLCLQLALIQANTESMSIRILVESLLLGYVEILVDKNFVFIVQLFVGSYG
jgi:hypothetical protein